MILYFYKTMETNNNIIGYTWNPNNRLLSSGGSSGGESGPESFPECLLNYVMVTPREVQVMITVAF